MRRAALFVHGRIVVGNHHGEAYEKLTEIERTSIFISGFYNLETKEFECEDPEQHFFDKEFFLIRHSKVKDVLDPDTDISPDGEDIAIRMANFLAENYDFDEFVGITSPLLRCLRTSKIFQEITNLHFEVNPSIMETPHEDFHLKNHKKDFDLFKWNTSLDWDLHPESPSVFSNRIKEALCKFPRKCIIITHLGTICNISRLALCEQKAQKVIGSGLLPASVTYINQQDVRYLTHENSSENSPTINEI